MQNRLNVRQKDHDGSQKTTCREKAKKYHFQKGGGINIVFGPKYRPLGIQELFTALHLESRVKRICPQPLASQIELRKDIVCGNITVVNSSCDQKLTEQLAGLCKH
jgi:hypothetical protein